MQEGREAEVLGWVGWVMWLHLSSIGGAFLIEEEQEEEKEGPGRSGGCGCRVDGLLWNCYRAPACTEGPLQPVCGQVIE
jgi:hypothetical protein